MSSSAPHLPVAAAALAVGGSRYLLRPASPDDWDAIGFTLALDRFDLAALSPHPPGYPVYVALGRALHVLVPSAHDAAVLASSLAATVTAAALWFVAARLRGARAGWLALSLYAAAWLPWLVGSSAWSDATAAALLAVAAALLVAGRPLASGAAAGLLLGARLSYLPLALSFCIVVVAWRRPHRARTLLGAAAGVLAWLVPLLVIAGPRALLSASLSHAAGHFRDFGGTVASDPDMALRLLAFARGLIWDGLAPSWPSLLVLALSVALALSTPASRSRLVGKGPLLAVVALPYASWALLGQNVIEQPRHLLPLVLLAVLLLALVLDGTRVPAVAAVSALLSASLPLALVHHRTEAPGAQLARHLADHAARAPASSVVVFGGRSVRFLAWQPTGQAGSGGPRPMQRLSLAEVDVDLERLDRLPTEVFVTSEVEVDARRAPRLRQGPTFCRDVRLERRQPCVSLLSYDPLGPLAPRSPDAR